MDPVAHTLLGGALATTGLGRRSRLATPTLLIGANLPDVDVAAYAWGETFALSFRRGWTHGALALVVLPLVLTGAMLLWDRWTRRPVGPPVRPAFLLALAALAVLTHPLLDLLNVYGVRLLMPFDGRWFYGDILFIVDPWVWAVLAVGIVAGRRRASPRAARIALAAFGGYVGVMLAAAATARAHVRRAIDEAGAPVARYMAAPVPLNPLQRWVVLDEGNAYRVGELDWRRGPPVRYEQLAEVPLGADRADVELATSAPPARQFLLWARFPFYEIERHASGTRVHVIDARYALDPDAPFGAVTVEVPD